MQAETMDVADKSLVRIGLHSAIITVLTLFGGMLLGVVVGNLVFESLPGHSVENPRVLHILLSAVPTVTGLLAGAAGWGIQMGKLAGSFSKKRMVLAGILGFLPVTILLGVVLQLAEGPLLVRYGAQLPIHRLFTVLFVPTAFLIAGISAGAIGLGLKNRPLAWTLFWQTGLAAAAAFFAVNILMESAGWVVGAPRAADRFTMLTVMFAGNLAAALLAGALTGIILTRHK